MTLLSHPRGPPGIGRWVAGIKSIVLACVLSLALNAPALSQSISGLKETYAVLVSGRTTGEGVLYAATAGGLNGKMLPLSFIDTPEYWAAYVCGASAATCAVADAYNPDDYSLQPTKGLPGELQTERINVHYGTNIYDAAVWQIAVMLGSVVNKYPVPAAKTAYDLVSNQNQLLLGGFSGNASTPLVKSGFLLDSNRARTQGQTFRYNGHTVKDGKEAYSFRMLPRAWLLPDPLGSTQYSKWISAIGLPRLNPEYQPGKVTWADWKPFTGENAWAFLLGPLHAAYIHYVADGHLAFVPFNDLAVQNALPLLTTFAAMQSKIGAVYYAPSQTLANRGAEAVNQYSVSTENNFSLYAGLKVLKGTLEAELANERVLNPADRKRINDALSTIEIMLQGGKNSAGVQTEGLLAFFKSRAWRNGEFVQGGIANDAQSAEDWIPTLQPRAIDVNTWGVSTLGSAQIDAWFGYGAAYRLWTQIKGWGGYGRNRELLGVGYSDRDGNGIDASGNLRQGVLSAEWTAGAINMVRNLIRHYSSPAETMFVAALKADERTMLEGLQSMRLDVYSKGAFLERPDKFNELIKIPLKSYVYSSRRYLVPFGWYANPIPSACSTSWVVMIADSYDPFGYGGRYN